MNHSQLERRLPLSQLSLKKGESEFYFKSEGGRK